MTKETTQEYIRRILGHVEGHDALSVQSSTAKKLEKLIKGASAAKLRKRPAPDKWSVVEILAHLADAETWCAAGAGRSWARRERRFRHSIRTYGRRRGITKSVTRGSHSSNSVHCARRISRCRSRSRRMRKHHGIHAERGEEIIERIAQMFAGHDINHTKQIERILAGKKAK